MRRRLRRCSRQPDQDIRDELAGERIDIVRYSDDPQVLIPNALQPATVEQVLLCDMIGRAIVLVREDQLSLAIGRRGQNVRLASKLCGWDIEIMTSSELEEKIDIAVAGFSSLAGITEEVAQALVEQGYLSYDDLSVIEPDVLMEMSGLSAEQVDEIVEQAEIRAHDAEEAAAEERRIRRDRDRQQQDQPSPPTDGGQADSETADELQAAAVQPQDDAAEAIDAGTEPVGEADVEHASLGQADSGQTSTGPTSTGQSGASQTAAGAGEGSEAEMVDDTAETTGSTPKSP